MSGRSIRYCDINRVVDANDPETSLLEISIANKIPHLHECGGNGMCTTCRIRVIEGSENLNPLTRQEEEFRKKRNWDPSIRLACQAKLMKENVSIERLVWTNAEVSNLQLETIPFGIGDERELVFLFCDMRNFTPLADKHSNFDLAHMLNRFFTVLGDPICMNNGIIYQYAGDEIIALFGTGGGNKSKICMDAIRAALGMNYAIQRLNKWEFKDFETEIKIGIGLHYGRAFVGNIGHPRHKQFAVIGDPVNVTSRIQAQNKEYGSRILASQSVMDHIPEDKLKIGFRSDVKLRGKEIKIPVYEILGFVETDTNLEVQATLDQLLRNEEQFAELFYEKVFQQAPQVRTLFQNNMLEQGRMLTHMLRGIINSLSRPEHLMLNLKSLGRQHVNYGVKHEHYLMIKEILLESIAEQLGEDYTDRSRQAWIEALDLIIETMEPVN